MNFLQDWGERVDRLAPVFKAAGDKADGYACKVIDLLAEIRDELRGTEADAYEYPRLWIPAGEVKTIDGREGYVKIIERYAIVAPAAADVAVYASTHDNSGFVSTLSISGAGESERFVQPNGFPVPEGEPIFVTADADCQVNLLVRRVKL